MTYFLLLIVVPAVAWGSGWLSQITGLNFWVFFGPVLAMGFVVYFFGPKIFKK